MFPLSIRELSASSTSYVVQIIHLQPVDTALLLASFDLIILSISHQTIAYSSLFLNNLHPLNVKFLYSL
jgi:hypothetical protein